MSNAWKNAATLVDAIARELSAKDRAELLQLPERSTVHRPGIPAGFEVTIKHMPMLNGTSAVEVEAARPYLGGLWWRSIISTLEVSPEGPVKHFPQRRLTQSGRESG